MTNLLTIGALHPDAVPLDSPTIQLTFGLARRWGPDGPIAILEYGGPVWPLRTARLQARAPAANRRAGLRVVALIPSGQERN